MKAITCNVIFSNFSSRVDGGLGVKFVTAKELTADEKAAFFELLNLECKVLIQPKGETVELKEIKGEFDKKSPSQRVRATMFVLWKYLTDTNQIEISFEAFYLRQMESYLASLKQQLPGIQ